MSKSWAHGACTVLGVHALWLGLILGPIGMMSFVTMNVAGLGAFITALAAPRRGFLLTPALDPRRSPLKRAQLTTRARAEAAMFARTAEKRFGALGRMGLVAAIHVAALFVIARSLGIVPKIDVAPPDDVQATIIEQERPPEPIPVIDDRVELDPLRVFVPTPEVPPIDNDISTDSITAEARPVDQIPIGPGSADPEPVSLVNVRADPRRPLSQPPYPASLIRNGTEGSVDVEVFVQPSGRVADARIVRSSGHELFDRATLDEARRNWRLLPATRNGEPYAQWYRLRVVFKLKNQQ